ncbi:angiopoietin-2-like [Aedes albopictus]|uniref:Fibrinogen C-terminal domain-containing protein n=1 Tax=Aedes albopictus TaxID=7160 RepID=A0ABM1YNT7_AEDAL
MFGNVRLALCVVLVLWSSTACSAAGSYDDVITKLDNLLYRVVMSEVNIKERLEETEDQLKKTLEQLDTLMEHQNGLVQNDDQLLAKIVELRDEVVQNQENIRGEFSSALAGMGQEVSNIHQRLDDLMKKQGELAVDQKALASMLIDVEQNVNQKFAIGMADISDRFNKTEEKFEEVLQNQESNYVELSSKMASVKHELNLMASKVMEGFDNADKRFVQLMQNQVDLATGHEVLTSALEKLEQNVSEQFTVTLTTITANFDKTNDQIDDLAKSQESTRVELSTKLTSIKQDLNHNFNLLMSNVVEGFETADKRIDRLMQHHADLTTGHEVLSSTLTGLELHVTEQFTMTLTNVTDHFDRTNDQIENLAKNQDNSRVELSSKLTTLKQDMNSNFNLVVSNVNDGFSKTNVKVDHVSQKQDDLAASQQTFTIALNKMNNDVSDKLAKISTNINERSDKLEDQHRTTKDQLDRLLQNMDNHRVEFSTVLTRIEQSTNQNFVTVTNYAVQILQQAGSCSTPQQPAVVTSCKNTPTKTSGQYQLKPFGTDEVLVGYCEQEKFNGGWLVIQHRFDGSVDFHRNWNDYKHGFGSIGGEFWLGLDKIHRLTSNKNVELIVELKDFNNNYIYARYDAFEIGSEPQKYSLDKLGTYSGTAGDSMIYNRGKKFTTKDNDNDGAVNLNCAVSRAGAWWFNWCGNADLNGMYGIRGDWRSVYWYGYNQYDGMKYTRMMIREK